MFKLKLPRDRKERLIESVQAFYEEEHGERLGSIAAERLLDHVIAAAGPVIYNQAVSDARAMLTDRFAAMEDELYALEVKDSTR